MLKNDEFYEHAEIFDNFYGTSKKSVEELIKKNDILFDIDWQGTQQLSKFKELNLTKIFILPPSKNELKKDYMKEIKTEILRLKKDLNRMKEIVYTGMSMIL